MNTLTVAIVVAKFNNDITDKLLQGALQAIDEQAAQIELKVVYVPGAVEVPLTAQCLARTKKYDAIITFAAVIYGETDHYHYVCDMVSTGCMRVMLDESLPVIFGVLTVRSREHALARVGGNKGHMGREAVESMFDQLQALRVDCCELPNRLPRACP